MSILSDLDPQNSRLRADNSGIASAWPRWLLILLLVLAGGVWLYHTVPASTDAPPFPNRPAPPPELAANTASEAVPDLAPSHTEEAALPSSGGSAVIRVSEGDTENVPDAPASDAASPEKSEIAAANLPTPFTALTTPEKAGEKKPAARSTPTKRIVKNSAATAGKTKNNRAATNQRTQKSTSSKEQERDVDIISVIVR